MIVKLDPLKKINVKIFSNGKIQMTGVKKESDCRLALNIIIQKLEKTVGKINIKKLLHSHQIKILQKYLNRKIDLYQNTTTIKIVKQIC